MSTYNLWINPKYNLQEIKDSMQIPSGETLAILQNLISGTRVSLEVRGDVKLYFNPTGPAEDGELYTNVSEFPNSLEGLIANDDDWFNNGHVSILENNWFEIFTEYRKETKRGIYEYTTDPNADLVDAEGSSEVDVFSILLDVLNDKERDNNG